MEGIVILQIILTGVGALALLFFGMILKNFDRRIDSVEAKGTSIETNYNKKFEAVHNKLDLIVTNQTTLLVELKEQAMYCKMVQLNKKENSHKLVE